MQYTQVVAADSRIIRKRSKSSQAKRMKKSHCKDEVKKLSNASNKIELLQREKQ
jgi:hypothetical protein